MYPYLGDFPVGTTTIFFPFHTFDSNGASVTMTGLAVTDIEVYKDAGMTQRASDSGYALVDTDGIDLDSFTGIHGFTIDISDDTTAGFYAAGHEYIVVVSAVSVDSQTVRFIAGAFSIERSGGALALLKGSNGLSNIKTDTAAILVDTGTTLDARIPAALVSGRMDASVGAMAANVMTAAAAASDLTTELQSGLATAAALAVVDDFLDTEIAAIKAKTDNLPSDPADASDIAALLATIDDFVDTEVAAIKAVTDKIDTALVLDGAVYQFTANALELAPAGGGSDSALLSGTAAAGSTTSVTLDGSASSDNDAYNLDVIEIPTGAGAGQSRLITDYDGTTKVATVDPAFTIAPDNTSTYKIRAFGTEPASIDSIVTEVWAAQRDENAVAGSFGEKMNANVIEISGDSGAADAAESFFDGTGLTLTNVVLPWNPAWDAEVESEATDAITAAALATAANLATLTGYVDTEVAAILAAVDTEVAAIKAKTDNLPTDPADASDVAALIAALEAKVDIIDGIIDSLTSRLPAALTADGMIKADSLFVNGVELTGAGTVESPMDAA